MNRLERVSFQAISSEKDFEFWRHWNDLVRKHGTNGFYLGGFIEYYMNACRSSGWTPLLVVMTAQERLVGGAALKTKGVIGGRTAELLVPTGYGTDFVVDPQYREVFIRKLLRFLMINLRCQFLELAVPSESPNLGLLKRSCMTLGFELDNAPLEKYLRKHSVIEVAGTWDEFRNSKGKNFIQRFRDTEKRLEKAGKWKINRRPLNSLEPEEIINQIERNSWKDSWRREKGLKSDSDLPAFFAYWRSKHSAGYFPNLWLLELNDVPIAYQIGLQLNGVAFLCKTSYDNRYAKMSPGKYVQNSAIQDMFDSGQVSRIDFLTTLPYMQRWTSLLFTRERVAISRPVPVLTTLIRTLGSIKYVRNAYKTLRRARAGHQDE